MSNYHLDKKIIDYKPVCSRDVSEMGWRVSEAIKEGWVPFGSPYFDGNYHAQAMVKLEDLNKENSPWS